MSGRRPGTDDTVPVAEAPHTTDATVATSSGSPSDSPLRRSRPSLTSSSDYPELGVVDPTHYVLGREIARGGMGRIWVARDRRLGRDVALKEVLVDTGAIVRRFEREARITARLQHPSIVSVHEAGVWPSGEPFYAMRLVSGRSLDEAIAAADGFAGRLALLPSVLAAADAMAYAHGQRVIHRDLKPRNVVVGDFGETVVIDWGLAKDLGAAPGDSLDGDGGLVATTASEPGETTAGDILGTPAYMPPEQAAGQPVDERADVYALGAMLYHLLSNEPPYRLPSGAEVIAAVMSEPPSPLIERAPATPSELVAIVERAMAREPAARYPTARELAEDLRRFQTGQLVGAHRYSTGQLVRRWVRRHRTAIAAVAAAAIVGIAIGVIALTRILAADRRVEAESARALASRKSAEELSAFMMGDLEKKLIGVGRLDLLDVVTRRAAGYYDGRGEEGTDEDRFELADAHNVLGGTFSKREDLVNARAEWDRAELLLAALIVRQPWNVKYGALALRVRTSLAMASIAQGAPSEQALRPIVVDADRLVTAHPHDAAALHAGCSAHIDLGDALKQSDPAASLAESARSLELANELAAVSHTATADQRIVMQAHQMRGDLLVAIKHDTDGALGEYRIAIAVADSSLAQDAEDAEMLDTLASVHGDLGRVLLARRDYSGATTEFEAGLAIAERLHRLDPSNRDWYGNVQNLDNEIGRLLASQHDYPGALEHYRAAESALNDLVAAAPSDLLLKTNLATTVRNIGEVQLDLDQVADALATYQHALAMTQALLATDPENVKWQDALYKTKKAMSRVLSVMNGRTRDALHMLREALAIIEKLADEHRSNSGFQQDLVETHVNLGQVLLKLHDLPAARVELHAAIDIAARIPPDDPRLAPFIAQVRKLLAASEHAKK